MSQSHCMYVYSPWIDNSQVIRLAGSTSSFPYYIYPRRGRASELRRDQSRTNNSGQPRDPLSMSLITDDPDDSPRDCSRRKHHHGSSTRGRGRRRALIAASSVVASLLSLAFILWLTLRPSSPRFSLLAATVTATDLSHPNATVVIDAAFTARNPNAHAAALYDRLQLTSASYAGVPLTAAAPLPPFDQLPQDDVVVPASLSSPLPVARAADVVGTTGGRALLRLRVEGQLRWKVAAWVSGRHALSVDCVDAVLLQPSPSSPRAVVGAVQGSQCATTVQ